MLFIWQRVDVKKNPKKTHNILKTKKQKKGSNIGSCQQVPVGSVGINQIFFLLSAKPEIVVPGSGILFRYFIFEISGKPSFVEAVLWREYAVFLPSLLSISTKS